MPETNHGSSLGYIFIFLCCLTNAISFVFIAHLNKTHNEMLNIAMTFGYASLLFNIWNFRTLTALYHSVTKNFTLVFYMNIATLFNWLGSFLSLNYLDPATALCINLGLIAVTNFFIFTPFQKFKQNSHLILCLIFIAASMVLIVKQHAETTAHITEKTLTLGVLWSVIGGFSGGFIGLCSERMGKASFSPTQILGTRFYMLIFVSIISLCFAHPQAPLTIDWKYYLLSSIIVVFFPLLMYQISIRSLGSMIVSLIEPLTPVFTYFLQIAVGNYRFHIMMLLLLLILSAAIMWFVRLEQNTVRAKYNF